MKHLYVTYMDLSTNKIETLTVDVEGKVNHFSVEKAVRDTLPYYDKIGARTILSWQEEDPFTYEEQSEFWKNYNK